MAKENSMRRVEAQPDIVNTRYILHIHAGDVDLRYLVKYS